MVSLWKYKVAETKLLYIPESLKFRRINQFKEDSLNSNRAVKRILNDFSFSQTYHPEETEQGPIGPDVLAGTPRVPSTPHPSSIKSTAYRCSLPGLADSTVEFTGNHPLMFLHETSDLEGRDLIELPGPDRSLVGLSGPSLPPIDFGLQQMPSLPAKFGHAVDAIGS